MRYRSQIVFSLGSCLLPISHAIAEAWYSGIPTQSCTLTSTRLSLSMVGRSRPFRLHARERSRALKPHIPTQFPVQVRFGLFPFHSPLLRESQLVSLPPPTWMLPFGGFLLPFGSSTGITRGGKSHSGISGSKAACAYPEHIAACHALLQCPSQAIRQVVYHVELTLEPTLV